MDASQQAQPNIFPGYKYHRSHLPQNNHALHCCTVLLVGTVQCKVAILTLAKLLQKTLRGVFHGYTPLLVLFQHRRQKHTDDQNLVAYDRREPMNLCQKRTNIQKLPIKNKQSMESSL